MFTVPRYFKGNFEVIQCNAIKSWLLLEPTPEIILCGNEEGTAAFAAEIGVKHIPDIELSSKGTPLVNSVFKKAQTIASHSIVAYVNSDVIFVDDFLDAIDKTSSKFNEFMIVGRRWDLDVPELINFSDSHWEENLRNCVSLFGKLHSNAGIDYHIFKKGFGMDMPPFIVGRPGWDNWFLSQAIGFNFNTVDATEKIFVVHQAHDYSHVEGGQAEGRSGEEARRNRGLAGKSCSVTTDTKWKFLNNEIVKRKIL